MREIARWNAEQRLRGGVWRRLRGGWWRWCVSTDGTVELFAFAHIAAIRIRDKRIGRRKRRPEAVCRLAAFALAAPAAPAAPAPVAAAEAPTKPSVSLVLSRGPVWRNHKQDRTTVAPSTLAVAPLCRAVCAAPGTAASGGGALVAVAAAGGLVRVLGLPRALLDDARP